MGAYALLVGISQFTDPRLAKLNAPRGDVEALAQVLQDPARGGFDKVETCIDSELQTIRDQLAALLDDRSPDDMVLLYYSGHGILTKGQRLFLATGQTSFDRPQARSLSALEMRDMLEQSRAGKQVVILDCCHSGAFVDGAKGVAQTVTDNTFGSDSAEGQYVLTATDALQFAYDATGALRESAAPAALSRFTGWLVDAIGKGDAAPDRDRITLDAVFDYLSRRARVEAAGMTPKRFVKRNSGEMVIAHNPSAQPAKLPEEIIAALDSKDWQARRDAVAQLGKLAGLGGSSELVERALTDRLSGERDVDVRDAMLKLLRRMGGSAPSELKPVPSPTAADLKPIAMGAGMRPGGDPPEPFWKRPKWILLAAGAGLAVILVVGGIVAGVRSYQRLASVASYAQQQEANRIAAEQARQAAIDLQTARKQQEAAAKQRETEAAAQRQAEATRQKEADAAKQKEAATQLAETNKLREAQAAKQREAAALQRQAKAVEEAKQTPSGFQARDCTICPEMVMVPAGSFTMGSPSSEAGRSRDEIPQHRVTIAKDIAVGKYEVTYAEWDACAADGGCNGYKPPDEGWGRGTHPVVNVSWNDAQAYIGWLRRKTGRPYRLLSESEWEYAARAATVSAFYWGARANPVSAKYNASNGTATVGSYAPNSFGLYDMSGNVSEWANDCLNNSYEGATADGSAWTTGNCDLHALRGGAWNSGPNNLRSANRDWDAAGFRVNRNGFRVARGL
jgi:formylglycine-generating enzyme required for sulfatase activity